MLKLKIKNGDFTTNAVARPGTGIPFVVLNDILLDEHLILEENLTLIEPTNEYILLTEESPDIDGNPVIKEDTLIYIGNVNTIKKSVDSVFYFDPRNFKLILLPNPDYFDPEEEGEGFVHEITYDIVVRNARNPLTNIITANNDNAYLFTEVTPLTSINIKYIKLNNIDGSLKLQSYIMSSDNREFRINQNVIPFLEVDRAAVLNEDSINAMLVTPISTRSFGNGGTVVTKKDKVYIPIII